MKSTVGLITVYRYPSENENGKPIARVYASYWRCEGDLGDGDKRIDEDEFFPSKRAALEHCTKTYPGVKVRYSTDVRNRNKRNIGKPGYCKFCGCQEDSHSHYEDGSESWDCPRCGFCEDYHLEPPQKPVEPANSLYNDVLGDLRIAYAKDRQWWRVEQMREDWRDEKFCDDDRAEIDRAYRDFEAEIKPFEATPNPVFKIDGIALEKVSGTHYIAVPIEQGNPQGIPYQIRHDDKGINSLGCHWYVERAPDLCSWFRTFDLALSFVTHHAKVQA